MKAVINMKIFCGHNAGILNFKGRFIYMCVSAMFKELKNYLWGCTLNSPGSKEDPLARPCGLSTEI